MEPHFLAALSMHLLIGGSVVPVTSMGGAVVMLDIGGANCTATVVGPRTLVTAAHCAVNSPDATFKILGKSSEQIYHVKIGTHPHYDEKFDFALDASGVDYDIALGLIDRPVADVKPIAVGGVPRLGEKLTLLGYGCTRSNETGGNNGKLKKGENSVQEIRGTGMILRGLPHGASICSGDSGGPALARLDNGSYALLGVNDEVGVDEHDKFKPESWEDVTTSPYFNQFFQDFIRQNDVSICGINSTCPAVTE